MGTILHTEVGTSVFFDRNDCYGGKLHTETVFDNLQKIFISSATFLSSVG